MNISFNNFSLKPGYAACSFKRGFFVLLCIIFSTAGICQTAAKKPSSWCVGIAGGANFNQYNGYTSAVNVDINATPAFRKGRGVGAYVAGLLEYHRDSSLLGLMLQQGLDSRRAEFNQGDRTLEMKLSYFTIEPSLVIWPIKKPLYIFVGPRLGLLWHTEFTYQAPNAPEYPQKHVNPDAYVKNLDKITASMQAGIGYDFTVSAKSRLHGIVFSPFATYLPSLDQNLRTIESLKLNTLRVGIILKTRIGSRYK